MLRLPDIIPFKGDWPDYEEELYSYFKKDFLDNNLSFNGLKVIIVKEPKFKGKEASFWHITSYGKEEGKRLPDLKKCERIRWIRPIIENYRDDSIKKWGAKRKNEIRICFCYGDWEYLVVLIKRRNYYLLLTAYPIERKHSKRKLQKQYRAYVNYLNSKKTNTAP